jgi:membrane-bound metal-dependent hydrolase YbcI (DUF457 family)
MIAGVAAGWLVAGSPLVRSKFPSAVAATLPVKVPATLWLEVAVFGCLGALPDVDLLVGTHRGPSHSLAAAIVVGIAVGLGAAVARGLGDRGLTLRPLTCAVACFAAYDSHVLLDWLGRDSSPPIGIMALWPFTATYYESDLHLFMAISRRYHQGWTFVVSNVRAVCLELVILVPLLALVMFLRPRSGEGEGA